MAAIDGIVQAQYLDLILQSAMDRGLAHFVREGRRGTCAGGWRSQPLAGESQ